MESNSDAYIVIPDGSISETISAKGIDDDSYAQQYRIKELIDKKRRQMRAEIYPYYKIKIKLK